MKQAIDATIEIFAPILLNKTPAPADAVIAEVIESNFLSILFMRI